MNKPFTFRADIPNQGVYFVDTLPRTTPSDVRSAQGLQAMHASTGKPITASGRVRSFSYDVIRTAVAELDEETLRREVSAGDADSEVLCVFLDFINAVHQHFPVDLYELCGDRKGLEDVASAMGIPVSILRGRLNGTSKLLAQELYLAKLRFPDMDLLSSLRRLADKSIAR